MTAKQIYNKNSGEYRATAHGSNLHLLRIREGNGSIGHAIQDNRLSGSAAYRLDVPDMEYPGDVGICLPLLSLPSVSSFSLPSARRLVSKITLARDDCDDADYTRGLSSQTR